MTKSKKEVTLAEETVTEITKPINISKRNTNIDNGEIITTEFLDAVIKKYSINGKYLTVKGYFNIEDNDGVITFADILNYMYCRNYEFEALINKADDRFVYGEILFKRM